MPRWVQLAFVSFLCLLGWTSPARADGGLLSGLSPVQSRGARNVAALNDGVAAREGDDWKTTLTTQLAGESAFVQYDLGAPRQIRAAWISADNNDAYIVEVSDDGTTFTLAWEAPKSSQAGLRARHASNLSATGRHVRLRARGGDGSFGISELALFENVPSPFPPEIRRSSSVPMEDLTRDRILVLAIAIVAAVLLAFRGASTTWTLFVLALPVAAAVPFASIASDAWPLAPRAVSLVRGATAAIALVAILRELLPVRAFPADRRVTLGALGLAAGVSFLAFYNLGHPQFVDESRGRPTFAHYYDLRQYHPTARFFAEVGYSGMYEADVAAYAENTNVSLESLSSLPIRDLPGKQDVVTVGARIEQIKARRAAFTPARWAAYKADSEFFRSVMGTDRYLETLQDFGGFATPLWIGIAHLLWLGPPSRESFTLTAYLDVALVLAAAYYLRKAFGLRTALVAIVVFGATDLVMYGTNWGGATLRHDWLAYLALGAAALRLGRYELGGALLAASTMIRAFPLLTVAAVAIPVVWWIADEARKSGKLPSFAEIRAGNPESYRVLLGAAVTAAILLAVSSLMLSPGSWPEWYRKVTIGMAIPHPADGSYRMFVGGWSPDRPMVLMRRMPVVLAGGLFFVGSAFVAGRRATPERAMLLGLPLVPLLLNPASYYGHFVFLFALLVDGAPGEGRRLGLRDAFVWVPLLFMCVAQYFAQLVTDRAIHFYLNNATFLVAMGLVLFALAFDRARAEGWISLPGEVDDDLPAAAPAAAPARAADEESAPEPEPAEADAAAEPDTAATAAEPEADAPKKARRKRKRPRPDPEDDLA